jgi:hypothetical protein
VSFIKKGWINKINSSSDYVVITSSIEDEKSFKCNCGDDYTSTAEKVKSFIKNYQFEDYDWYFLIDDDVFVFPERFENYIEEKNIDPNSPTIIANVNCYFSEMKEDSFCGGAGILMTKKTGAYQRGKKGTVSRGSHQSESTVPRQKKGSMCSR